MSARKYKATDKPLARSILSSLHEPLYDLKDGRGAPTPHDVLILRKWASARNGGPDAKRALMDLLKFIFDENFAELKSGRQFQIRRRFGTSRLQTWSIIPAMALLKLVTVETVEVAPERDGHATVRERKKVLFTDWFDEYALGRKGISPDAVARVRAWQDCGSIQRPYRIHGED